ncbi:hypothetical protein [Streptomyces sp. NPDC001250]|uniref:hypothetical protein n=1 Tax=unclassified Streptomyces TaxID=2593676 RepID=UPI00332FA01C
MHESSRASNHINGTVGGPAVQAKVVYGDVSITAPAQVADAIRGVRSLRITATVFRLVVSLAGCAAVYGVWHGSTPLSGLAKWCDALSVPSDWTSAVAAWMDNHAGGLGLAATAMVTFGLITMPAPRRVGEDLGRILEWRGPSTTVLGLAVAAQCGILMDLVVQTLLWSAVALWLLGRSEGGRFNRTGRMRVAVVGVLLAVLFTPIALFAWGYGRDSDSSATAA